MSRRPPQPSGRPSGRPNPSRRGAAATAARGAGRALALSIAGILVVAALAVLLVGVVGHSPSVGVSPLGIRVDEATPTTLPPEPRLEAAPGESADFVRAREDPILNGYGWVDQKNGITRIPIDQAMRIVAQQGLPARPPTTPTAQDEGLTLPSYSSSGRYPEVILH